MYQPTKVLILPSFIAFQTKNKTLAEFLPPISTNPDQTNLLPPTFKISTSEKFLPRLVSIRPTHHYPQALPGNRHTAAQTTPTSLLTIFPSTVPRSADYPSPPQQPSAPSTASRLPAGKVGYWRRFGGCMRCRRARYRGYRDAE